MKILVFGTGGVGSIYAYILAQSNRASTDRAVSNGLQANGTGEVQVTVVCRSNYTAVKENGIYIISAIWGNVHFHPWRVVKSIEEAASAPPISNQTEDRNEPHGDTSNGPGDGQEVYDYILISTKSFPNQAHLIKAAVTPSHTTIILAQNGIGIEQEYADAYPYNTVITGVVYLPTTQTSPGYIRMGPLQQLHIGSFPASPSTSHAQKAIEAFAKVFSQGGGNITVHANVQRQRWIKLIANAPWNPMCALTGCDDGNLLRSSSHSSSTGELVSTESVVRAVIAEVALVADASGYTFSPAEIETQMARPLERMRTGGKEPSMLTDVREGRALEWQAILGNLVGIAREKGVDVVRLEMLLVLARGLSFGIEKGNRWLELGM